MELLLGAKRRQAKCERELAFLLKEINGVMSAFVDQVGDSPDILEAIAVLCHAEASLWLRPVEFGLVRFKCPEPYYAGQPLRPYLDRLSNSTWLTEDAKAEIIRIEALDMKLRAFIETR